ncbi:MAG TPA: hypothetical protein VL463_03025 [Kofleriaceae bacterium]|nr:hypothetical protein [Kofleriaceae bacterium]
MGVLFVCASARLASAQPADLTASFDPLSPDGWPRGLSLEDLRALPECGPGGLSHTPGAPVTCRPAVLPGPVQWSLGIDWTSGAVYGDLPTEGAAHALGVETDFALSSSFEVAGRWELMGVGLPDDRGAAMSNHLMGLVKYRLWDDETGRSAWTIGAGGGLAIRGDELGGTTSIVRASLAREIGMYVDDSTALDAALELAYEQSLGDARVQSILASFRLGFETQIREPSNLGEPEPTHFRHTTSYDVIAGPFLGLGMGLGLRASRALSLETNADYLFGFTSDAKEHGFDTASWSLVTGPRVTLPFPEVMPLYVQAQGGAAWVSGASGGELRPIATGEIGFRVLAGCASGVDLGAWLRADVQDGVDVNAAGLMMRLVFGSGAGAAGDDDAPCVGRGAPMLAMPYVPPPPSPTVATETYTVSTADVHVPDVHVPDVSVSGNVDVNVAVPAPQPIVVDVQLGAAFYGMQVSIDPRVLPFDRLRGAGWIEVELSGSGTALASFQGELNAALTRGGVQVNGWSRVDTGDSIVRARFTIWPPGSRPQGR